MSDRRTRSPDEGGHDGPWSNLPPETTAPVRPGREPLLQRRKGPREPFVRNWKGMAIIVFLLFIAPPLCGWISRLILSSVSGG